MKTTSRKKTDILPKQVFLSMGITFLGMLVIFLFNWIYPFGERSFLHIDMYHQYFPMLMDFKRALNNTAAATGITYSYSSGLGTNYLPQFAYYLATPTNLIAAIWPEKYLMEFISYMVPVKLALASGMFTYYLMKHFKKDNMAVVIFGIFYGLSGFSAAYNWNVMWLDVLWVAPLVILGLEKLCLEGKYKLYVLSLGFCIYTNYYLSIMLCIFIVLYFGLVCLPAAEKRLNKICLFAGGSLLAGGLGAIPLVSSLSAMKLSKYSSSSFPQKAEAYFDIIDVLSRHMIDIEVETGLDHWPNIFCSVFVMMLIPLYIINSRISIKEKIGRLSLAVFLVISFTSNVLTFLWHGLNYPNSLPCRQSFLYIILVLTMSYDALMDIRKYKDNEVRNVMIFVVAFILAVQKLTKESFITGRSILLSALFCFVYGLFLYYIRMGQAERKKFIAATMLVFSSLEMIFNTYFTSVSTVSRDSYLKNFDVYSNLYNRNNELAEGSFFRFENVDNRIRTDESMLHNYTSASLFSSAGNSLVNNYYKDYGMRTSKVFYSYDGMTPFMGALLGCKYLFYKNGQTDLLTYRDAEQDVLLYERNEALPVGFILEKNEKSDFLAEATDIAYRIIDGKETNARSTTNPFDAQNKLAYNLGAQEKLFTKLDSVGNGKDYLFYNDSDSYLLAYSTNKKIDEIRVNYNGGEKEFDNYSNPYIMDLGFVEAGEEISFLIEEGEGNLNMSIYSMNIGEYRRLFELLQKETLEIDSFDNNKITGDIYSNEEGYMVLSIPFDPGFTVLVDGIESEIMLWDKCFMAVALQEGSHRIEINYYPGGLNIGIAVFVISVAVFIFLLVRERKGMQV